MSQKTKSVLIRFLKGFIAGGISTTGVLLQAGITVTNVHDIKTVGFTLATSFLTGGLLAIEKMLNWQK